MKTPKPSKGGIALPFAGICGREESQKLGMSVAASTQRLRRLFYVKRKLAWMAACHLNHTPEWELKAALALHAWQDMQHADLLRLRVLELRETEASLNEIPDAKLAAVINEAIFSDTSVE